MKKAIILLIISINAVYSQDYFQQEVNYQIDVLLDDKAHTLNGFLNLEYTNNSKNTLDVLWFHLWPNAYKNNSTALGKQKLEEGDTKFYYASDDERGYIDSMEFKINGNIINWEYHPEHIDICKLILKNSLNPGETIKISTPFFVKIPDAKFSRLGHVEQSYMITQWYPKPAVYDNNGWHIMPYLNQGEFYSEFGSFDVKITLPSNYIVGATGNLQNELEINYLNKLAKHTDTISVFSNDMSFPKSNLDTKTLHYKENNIHDFGWFADKRFNVLKGLVELPYSKDTVTLWCMFTNNEADLWKNSIEYMHDATYYYSLWNGDYPYKQCSAVDGTISAGGGMEYPGVTVIGEMNTAKALEEVIMHEVGHNWFYGMLGSNERSHPWMDEGLNTHNELRYMRTKYPGFNIYLDQLPEKIIKLLDLEGYDAKQTMLELNMMLSRTGQDQPIELHSEEYTMMNYGLIAYMKTAIVFDYLMAYLGEDVYDECMKTYFETWKFKHPKPENLKSIFEEKTDKNLDWFFDDVINTTKQIDYAITHLKKEQDNFILRIKNKGDINSPFVVSGIKDNKEYNPIWIEGFKKGKNIKYPFSSIDYDYIQIDFKGDIPEVNRNNNIIRTSGILKKIEPVKYQLLGSINNAQKTQIFFMPNYDWNYYDKSLIGLKLYNRFLPSNGFSYTLSPLYSIQRNALGGNLAFAYEKYKPAKFIQKLKAGLLYEKYSHQYGSNNNTTSKYNRIEPFLEINLTKKAPRSKKQSFFRTNLIYLDKGDEQLHFINTKYTFSNNQTLNPYSININSQFGQDLQKASVTMKYKYAINKKRNIKIRGYFGIANTNNSEYYLNMSAWNGTNDYTFSNPFLGRSETTGLLNQQIIEQEGFIKHETNITSQNILTSVSAELNLKKIIKIYAEAGTNGNESAYGLGLKIPLLNGATTFYIPLLTEKGLIEFNNTEFIRYTFKLNLSDFSSML